MSQRFCRTSTGVLLLAGALLCTQANAQQPATLNIASEPLSEALRELGTVSNINIMFEPAMVKGIISPAVKGEITPREALTRLLAGTQWSFKFVDENTVSLVPRAPEAAQAGKQAPADRGDPPWSGAGTDKEVGKSSSQNFLVAQMDQEQTSGSSSLKQTAQAPVALQEVIVTAQKRSENLLEVPVPVTALSAQSLLDSNKLRLQDYYTLVPGLNVTPDDFGTPQVTIRGLTTGAYTNPTVGIVVDDVPFGSSSALGYGQQMPDIDPSDLQRVEVLRGPQGTLYGANSLGGLLKYVTIDPSTDRVTGHIQAGGVSVQNGAELGYSVRGTVNVPLNEQLAIRGSVFTREDPGYVDNVESGQRGVNKGDFYGGRVAALWRPSTDISMKVSALYQNSRIDGSPYIGTGLADLQQSDARGTGWYHAALQAYSATVTGKLSGINIISVSGYNITRVGESFDYTPLFAQATQTQFGVAGTPVINHQEVDKFTQEVRFSASAGKYLDWLAGAFYNHENSPGSADLLATDPVSGALVGQWEHSSLPSTFAEAAVFAALTLHFTDQFDVQFGGRESQNRQSDGPVVETGPYLPVFLLTTSPNTVPKGYSKDSSFTYLVTPRLKLSPELMLYARLASGYQPGGINLPGIPTEVVPPTYRPDTTNNYELGAKGDLLDHMFTYDVSLYYIDWKDIQLQLFNPMGGYVANGSRAKSEGVELSVEARPLTGLTATAWMSWDDAQLTQSVPAGSQAYGSPGERLPYSPRWSGNFSLEQQFPVTNGIVGVLGGAVSYIGDREGVFASVFSGSPARQYFPGYWKLDLRAGVTHESWALHLNANNVTNKRGLVSGGLGTFNVDAFQYIQPRTISLLISKKF